MTTLGIELCDAGFRAAAGRPGDPSLAAVADAAGGTDWPGFAASDGRQLLLGRAAEDEWLVHPRRVSHHFWSRLAHEPSPVLLAGKAVSFSELAYHFLREFLRRTEAAAGRPEQVVLAVPGAYLKDAATEEEKVGLLLGMAGELRLPLAGIVDLACAALCDPRSAGFNPSLPVVVLDVQLDAAEVTLVSTGDRLERRDFLHLPHHGLAHLLKLLTGTMGNRFLGHTAFDILADGRLEQMFFRQTKDFLLRAGTEQRYQINTANRTYEMLAKREQLTADAQAFVQGLVQGLQGFVQASAAAADPCTLALTDRAALIPGLEPRLRAAGFVRLLRLPAGAGAAGAVQLAAGRLVAPPDLADVAVETALPIALARRAPPAPWEAVLRRIRPSGDRMAPTHVVLDGLAHPLGSSPRFTIARPGLAADLALPAPFAEADGCSLVLLREQGRLWFADPAASRDAPGGAHRQPVEAGDCLTVRSGGTTADLHFVHVPPGAGRSPS